MQYSVDSENDTPSQISPRRHWLLPLLTLASGLAVIGIYYVPAYPDLGLPITILLLACIVGLVVLTFYVYKTLKEIAQVEAIDQAGATPVVRRSIPQAPLLVSVGMSMAVTAASYLAMSLVRHEYSLDISQGASIASFFAVGLLTLLWPRLNSSNPARPWMNIPVVRMLPHLLAFLLLMFFSWLIAVAAPTYLTSGPAASWPRLLEFARAQAEQIDKNIVLSSVSARIMYNAPKPHTAGKTPMSVDFDFLGASSGNIIVEVLDTDPPRLRRISNPDFARQVPAGEQVSRLKLVEDSLKVSPREAYRLTERAAQRLAQEKGITVEPSLRTYLGRNSQELYGVPVIWEIYYYSPDFDTAFSAIVDASTGNVLRSSAGSPSQSESESSESVETPIAAP